MSEFAVGQRWVSQSESNLGLGLIVAVEGRQLKINFPAVNEDRIYAIGQAPLSRIEYKPGENIHLSDGITLSVIKVETENNRLFYHAADNQGNQFRVDECELDSFIEFTTPKQRFGSGQLDDIAAYKLRCETLQHLHRLQQSPVQGLLGSRTSLLEHQAYIAYEVAKRHAPRVLLADEVGLGKTIEAGMILHAQILTGLANRVLIIVPPTLTHQWLVEMLRRFNLQFALFDSERLAGLIEAGGNPFESEQLIICSLDDLCSDPQVLKHALGADWDMLVVDEAHHLHWADDDSGHDYRCIEALAQQCPGLLLLTATPEQAGISSHFARLRLLDPARYHDLDKFILEQDGYQELNTIVKNLLEMPDQPLSEQLLRQISNHLQNDSFNVSEPSAEQRAAIVDKLLDRNGTGRVFLRNTREAIKGFPARKLLPQPLPVCDIYKSLSGRQTLYPETHFDNNEWLENDPRVTYLIELLQELRPEKVLVICANTITARALEKHLQLRAGVRSTAFHEEMTIIERDRAAAYFADSEGGAQVLICSEIGSEGRNFQFAHHLVLFDLPANPDLLEQRIGRLDRIGQKHDIKIHMPYLEETGQAILFNWYNQGLSIFTESCAAAYSIYEKFQEPLSSAIETSNPDITGLIKETSAYTQSIKKAMYEGRDRLIELQSCRKDVAANIIETIKTTESPVELMDYMELMFDCYGVDHEEHSENCWILHPSDHMRIGYFPGLSDDSITVTYERDKALSREDFSFISWEHPIVSEAMEMVLSSEVGNTSISTIETDAIEPGTILLESFSGINTIAPKSLQIGRYLPLSPFRTLFSNEQKDYTEVLSHEMLNELSIKIEAETAAAIIKQLQPEIEKMIDYAVKVSETRLPAILKQAKSRADQLITTEIERLQYLQKQNANIREEEVDFFKQQLADSLIAIEDAKYGLQAVRLVITQ